ncbi:MAG: FkbM family methyltransferase [Proteobacteria bacterium]|nr:FkbM family methyltransferase [Pseudomonadota bacterium]
MPSLKSLVGKLPDDVRLTLADVGSAGGLKPRWKPLAGRLRGLLFDPRDDAGPAVDIGHNRIYPVALGEGPGTRELRVTAIPILSSLLEPTEELLTFYRKKGVQGRVERRVSVPIEALDTLLEADGLDVDAMKIDTQGTELEILKGAARALERSVLTVEAEMSFFERYVGQVVAPELLAWMHARGYRLIEIYRPKRYIRLNSFDVGNVGIGAGHRAGQLGHGDAIFMATDALLERRWATQGPDIVRHQVLALILLLSVYGKVDMAAAAFDTHRRHLDDAMQEILAGWFKGWYRAEYRTRGWHAVVDYLARRT